LIEVQDKQKSDSKDLGGAANQASILREPVTGRRMIKFKLIQVLVEIFDGPQSRFFMSFNKYDQESLPVFFETTFENGKILTCIAIVALMTAMCPDVKPSKPKKYFKI